MEREIDIEGNTVRFEVYRGEILLLDDVEDRHFAVARIREELGGELD